MKQEILLSFVLSNTAARGIFKPEETAECKQIPFLFGFTCVVNFKLNKSEDVATVDANQILSSSRAIEILPVLSVTEISRQSLFTINSIDSHNGASVRAVQI